jgi:hypothetical protein
MYYRRCIPRQPLRNQPIKSPTHQRCQNSKNRIALRICVFWVGDGIYWPFGFVEKKFEFVTQFDSVVCDDEIVETVQ